MTQPWMEPLSPETRAAVERNLTNPPPLSPRQRDQIRLIFQAALNQQQQAS